MLTTDPLLAQIADGDVCITLLFPTCSGAPNARGLSPLRLHHAYLVTMVGKETRAHSTWA
jgi:hypothetical protein